MQVSIDPESFAPVIAAVVAETIAAIQTDEERLGDQIAFSEQKAARLVDMEPHQLRDERLRGRIGASQIVGRRIRYTRSDLLQYLARNRSEPRI
ncbi:helix-turn-helix domain-containing protein [Schlesneria sp. T3-172]|uniref:helix-turn-helix domain-containing protein n=1 Tax=Schlesneria sphaerica TaxID=3373610 RepID=UPI0037CC2C38